MQTHSTSWYNEQLYKFSPDLGAVHKSRRQKCRSEVYTFLRVGWGTFSSELSWTPKTHPNDSRATAWPKQQQSCYLVVFFEFNSAFGRNRHWLVLIAKPSFSSWMIGRLFGLGEGGRGDFWVWRGNGGMKLTSYCLCRRPSWTPKTQPNDSSAVVWLSFWCSTRFAWK